MENLTGRAAESVDYHIVCEDLFKIYKMADLEVVALQGLDLRVRKGEIMAIVGASGSGKTSLLNILGGLDTPSAGKVLVGGHDLLRMSERDLVLYRRRHAGFLWQQTARNLVLYFTALQNVEVPLIIDGWPAAKRRQRACEILEAVDLGTRLNHRVDRLSGGEQQRVAIAVALATSPPLLLADEPTGELDTRTGDTIFSLFRYLRDTFGVTIVTVTHDPSIARRVDRVVLIKDGRISTETLRTVDAEHGEAHLEFVVLDSAGRLQLPEAYLAKLKMRERVEVRLESDHISVWPGKDGREGDSN